MNRISLMMFAAAVIVSAACNRTGGGLSPDLIIYNGRITTIDDRRPEVEAVAALDGMIVAVGGSDEIRALAGDKTRLIDLGGRRVVPGFNDAHVHFLDGGMGLASVQLRDAGSEEEFARRIGEFASKMPKGRWLLNGNWDHENWKPARLPTRLLDRKSVV